MNFFNFIKGDKVIWLIVIFLSVFSVLAVYSSTGTLAYRYQGGNTSYYLLKHFLILIFGFVLMYIAHLVKYTYFSRISQIALFVSIPLLIFTLFSGTNINQANRWLTLPIINLSFQSSDFAKLALIMYVARLLTKKQDQIKDFKSAFLPVMLPIIVICALILPANFSTAAILFTTCLVLLFIGRINLKYILTLVMIGITALIFFLTILYNSPYQGRFGTWKSRIESYLNPENIDGNYQTEQSKIAIATGGFFGKFPGNSTQRNFIPHPYSDFIFAIIIEEYGLLGGVVIVFLYLMLLFRSFRIVSKSPGTFSAFLTFGLSFSLVFQAMINMGVAVNIFPVTGQPLPLISMGGTSIWFSSLAVGIILSVSKELETEKNNKLQTEDISSSFALRTGGMHAE